MKNYPKVLSCLLKSLAFALIYIMTSHSAKAQSDSAIWENNISSLRHNAFSLNIITPITVLAGARGAYRTSLYFTHQLNPRIGIRLGVLYQNKHSFHPIPDTLFGENVTSDDLLAGRLGVVHYARYRRCSFYYGLDVGYAYRMYSNADWYERASDRVQGIQDIGRYATVSPVLGFRYELSRHFSLALEESPDLFFGKTRRTLYQMGEQDEAWTILRQYSYKTLGLQDLEELLKMNLLLIFKF